jgi:hypothetical protein
MKNKKQTLHTQIRVDNPCHEDWDSMSPSEQGRFCGVCQTEVVDFIRMSDDEIIAFFQNYEGQKVCGRVITPSEPVAPKLLPPKIVQRKSWRAIAASALIAATLIACEPNKTTSKLPPNILNAQRHGKSAPPIEIRLAAVLKKNGLRGTTEQEGKKIANANVQLFSNNKLLTQVKSNENGEFQLLYPQYDPETHKNVVIRTQHPKYQSTPINIKHNGHLYEPIKIEMRDIVHKVGIARRVK